jgi:hypothetical protein
MPPSAGGGQSLSTLCFDDLFDLAFQTLEASTDDHLGVPIALALYRVSADRLPRFESYRTPNLVPTELQAAPNRDGHKTLADY